ncbi:MAG TPA: VOC family protein [Caulobacteraceae bacterium]|nr:VOC family protein [Caulobacteraceae bacterium]
MRRIGFAALALALLASPSMAAPAPIVFFDIAGPQLASQAAFYRAVFGWEANSQGGLSVPVTSPLPGNLRVEPPSQGPLAERVIYVGVPDIVATLARVTANGGSVVFGRMVAPGVVILALFKDPAGNRNGAGRVGRRRQADRAAEVALKRLARP